MRQSAIGAVLMQHIRIGGRHPYPGPLLTYVQVDGSYRRHDSYVAAILTTAVDRDLLKRKQRISAISSTEAEWAAIAFGLRTALEHNESATRRHRPRKRLDVEHTIALENDNLGVIHALLFPDNPLKHHYARHYRNEIQKLAANSLWTGVR